MIKFLIENSVLITGGVLSALAVREFNKANEKLVPDAEGKVDTSSSRKHVAQGSMLATAGFLTILADRVVRPSIKNYTNFILPSVGVDENGEFINIPMNPSQQLDQIK